MHSPPSNLFYQVLNSIGDHVLTSNLVYLHVLLHITNPLLHLQSRHRPRKGKSYFILHLLNPYDKGLGKTITPTRQQLKNTPNICTQTRKRQKHLRSIVTHNNKQYSHKSQNTQATPRVRSYVQDIRSHHTTQNSFI